MAKDKAGNSIKTANQTAFNSLKPKAINFSDSIGGNDASDYFRASLKSRTSVELSLTGLKQDANLQLLQKSGKVIKQSNKKGKSDEAIKLTLDSGVYYFHVVGTSKETGYTLRATGNRDNGGDKVDSATSVTVNDGKTVFKDYIGPSDKADVYQFTTSSNAPQQLNLTLSGLKADANLAILGSDGKPITSSKKSGTAKETITQTLMPDTTYFMKVSAGRKQPGTPYKLLSNLSDVPDGAGNTRDEAAAKFLQLPALSDSFSTLVTELLNVNDVDVFRIVGPNEPTSVDLKLTGLSEDADLFLYEEGNPVAIATSDQGGISNEAINGVILAPGVNYYIEVAPYAPSKYTFFTLSARTQFGINDSAGNTPVTARNIDDDPVWQAGNLGVSQGPLDPTQYADAVGSFDTDDYYVFTLNQTSFLKMKADLTSGSANLRLIGEDGTTVLESVSGTTSSQPKIEGVFPKGTYYIRVNPNGGSTASALYELNLAAESVELDPAFVKDIRLGPESSGVPGDMVEIGGLLYFAADDGTGVQLWRTDGTGVDGSLTGGKDDDGTEKLTNEAFTSLENLTVASIGGSNVIFFTAGTAETGTELWRWDAVNGASLVKDIAVGTGSSGIGTTTGIVAVGDRVYFDAIEQGSGTSLNIELWYSDGTEAGTQSLELVPGEFFGSFPRDLINVNDTAYFVASNGSSERLFTIDTSGGTVTAVEVAGQDGLSNFGSLTNVKGTLYFTASGAAEGGSTRGNEIWRISSTTGKPEAVADIVAGSAGAASISNLSVLGDSLFFAANGGSAGAELWEMKINPSTKATTVAIAADINVTAANAGSNPQQLTVVDGKLFFLADDGISGQGLWRYDPAAAVGQRTSLVQYDDGGVLRDVAASGDVALNPSAGSLIAVGGFLYFKATRDATGSELWRVSPLLNGNAEELDLLAGDLSSSPSDFTEVNGRLFFRATDAGDTDESVGRELWVVGLAENP